MKIPFFSSKKKKEEKESNVKKTKTKSKIKKVTIYSTKTCPWCKKTKEFFKENGIKFTNKDVGSNKKNAQEMVKKSGQKAVPVTDIGGTIVIGFNEEKLRRELGL